MAAADLPRALTLIAGPCAIESRELALSVAEELARLGAALPGLRVVFKASYDKANRTSIHAFRGPGLDEGLRVLDDVRTATGLPVLTDVHTVPEAEAAGDVVDFVQIPAFLCRQTDLLLAAAATGCAVNVKKGQFLGPTQMGPVVEKLRAGGATDIWVTERGTTFGYGDLVVDMRSLVRLRDTGAKVVFDATHSVQRPGALGDRTGGDRGLAPALARAAVAVGVDALFIETHPRPDEALSDGPNMIPLAALPALLPQLLAIHELRAHD